MTKTNLSLILNRNIDTIQPPEWLAEVQNLVTSYREADPAEQAIVCGQIGETYGPEAEREAVRLFAVAKPLVIKPAPASSSPIPPLSELIKSLVAPTAQFNIRGLDSDEPEPDEPAWKSKLEPFEDWHEWLAAAVEIARTGEAPADEIADEAERWGSGGREEFEEALRAAAAEGRIEFDPEPDQSAVEAVVVGASEWAEPEPVSVPARPAPGLLGELADYITASAMYPSTKWAVATGLVVMGTMISQRIAGPSGPRGTGTHLYIACIGPTGSGKEHIRQSGKHLLSAARGGSRLIGPGRFKSGAGIVNYLRDLASEQGGAVACSFIDELGAMFSLMADPKTSPHVRDANEVLRELWGLSFGRYDSPAGAADKSKPILCPALSLIGMTTPRELYQACRSRDISNGFLNRFLFVEERVMPPYQRIVASASDEIPKSIRDGLSKLYQPVSLLDWNGAPTLRLAWGRGAEEVYDAVRDEIANEPDDRKRELFIRTAEKTVRVASVVAAGRFSREVSRGDMEWSRDWVLASDETLLAGVNDYMEEEKFKLADLYREVLRRIKSNGNAMPVRKLKRSFQNNKTHKDQLTDAVDWLKADGRLVEHKVPTGGRPKDWYIIEGWAGNLEDLRDDGD
jgi:hypothetical protein